MSSVLVVEQEPHYVERIKAALAAEGWRVRVVASVDQALPAAAAEPPDLVMAGTDLPGFEVLVFSFSRAAGGPGLVGLAPSPGGRPDGADGRLAKPFTDQQVVLAARQILLAARRGVAPAAADEQKLTSRDIFGDVLAEVESDLPQQPAAPPRPAPPAAPKTGVPAAAGDEEIQRRLEETLSGVLGVDTKPRPAAPPAPRAAAPPPPSRRPELAAGDVDALLSKTLSNLDLGRTKTGVRPPAPAAVPAPAPLPPPSSPPPAAVSPAAPPAPVPAAERTAVRKSKAAGDFDFSELEDLARFGRSAATPPRPATPRPVAPPAPAPDAAAIPVPMVPSPPAPAPELLPSVEILEPRAAAEPTPAQGLADAAATQRMPVFIQEPGDQPSARFGQYTLLERIAVGGMAEVWKARMRGVEGFQKTVAIKRILTQMTDNSEFVGMFIDEAKLAAQLTHPNIVHIYDLGKIGRDYYIAMEYVEGRDLRSLLNAGRRRGTPLPLGLALLIAARVASALDYAHRKRDFEGREMGLVHRDISPQNVLLTYEGDVKLCDFGIAKAVSKASQTQMGALKGKLQYMSPEQAWGRAVDARSDLFSLGAVLFEMVTGDRLFPGDSEMSVLELVRQGSTRTPRQVDPSLPREVDDIVARALAIDPQDRFQNAGEMKQRLEAALASQAPSIGPTDLAAYIRLVLEPESADSAGEAGASALPLPAAGKAEPASPPPAEPVLAGTEATVEPVAPLVEVAAEDEGGRRSRTLLFAAIAALIVVAVVTFFIVSRRGSAPGPQSAGSPETPAATVPAASPAPTQGVPPAAAPATQSAPAPGMPADQAALVNKLLAERQQEMRRKSEENLKGSEETLRELERQLAEAKAKAQPPPAAPVQQTPVEPTPAPTAPPRPAIAEPESAAPAPEPEPQREPEAPVQERAATAEPTPVHEPEPPPAPRVKVGDLVSPGPGVVSPQLVSVPKPEYPPMARNLRVEGTVVVSVLVDENGHVLDVKVAEPIKQRVGLNEAALAAARSARYRPAMKEGIRVRMWTRLKVPFKL